MNGRSEFKVKIGKAEVREITQLTQNNVRPQTLAKFVMSGAPYDDVRTADILLALEEYLKAQRCIPDFELVLND